LMPAAWLALVRAHAAGINFLLSVMCLVWVADIAAYAGGRLLGRHKLAPTISPGKTWEGALSGAAAVLLLGLAWWAGDRHFGAESPGVSSRLVAAFGLPGAAAALLLLSAASVLGDLFESLVKRATGAKDSSRLLPGHGGVLDRIDALLPVFPLVLALGVA
jgi:phosphatidate cytidylyltransferase